VTCRERAEALRVCWGVWGGYDIGEMARTAAQAKAKASRKATP